LELSDIRAKVLIIDDDADIRNAVRLTLESESGVNYVFSEAGNVASGLTAVKSTKPTVIILDLHMPGENGFDFMNKLQKDGLFPRAKVIILTADNSIKNLLEAESKGVNAYHFMGKPFVNDDLRALVLSLVLPM
jgi:CheY-like chemotaxis protein